MSTPPENDARVCVAQIGSRRHYAVPAALQAAGCLERLFTDVYLGNKPIARFLASAGYRVSGSKRLKRLAGRGCTEIPPSKVTSFEWSSLGGHLFGHDKRAAQSAKYSDKGSRFSKLVSASGFGNANVVYGFNAASLEIFQSAKESGLACVLDQTIIPMQLYYDLIAGEIDRWPNWQPGLSLDDDYAELIQRDRLEWELADAIICGSSFVAESIAKVGGPGEKCRVVPYGHEAVSSTGNAMSVDSQREPGKLKLLFVGEVGIRKGVPYLLEAADGMQPFDLEIRFAGRVKLNPEKLRKYESYTRFLGHLPREEMQKLYRWADALVMPSLCEGSAMVTYEALANDIPVICTPSTGANFREGIDGILVPEQDSDSLAQAIADLPKLIEKRSQAPALGTDTLNSRKRYQDTLRSIMNDVIG